MDDGNEDDDGLLAFMDDIGVGVEVMMDDADGDGDTTCTANVFLEGAAHGVDHNGSSNTCTGLSSASALAPGASSSTTAGNRTANNNNKQQRTTSTTSTTNNNKKNKKPPPAASSAPTESFEYITTDQINPHDVLCGRGAGIVTNPGNENFRNLIAARKDEYLSATRRGEKNEIARAICHHIRTALDPPGRFLKRATNDRAARWGFGGEEAAADVWVPVDEATMLERAKQSLREKDVKYIDKIRMGEHHLKRKTGGGNKSKNNEEGGSGMASSSHVGVDLDVQQQYPISDRSGPISNGNSMLGMAGGGAAISAGGQMPTHMQQNQLSSTWENDISLVQQYPPDVFGGQTMGSAQTIGWGQSPTPTQESTSPDTFSLDQIRGSVPLKDWISNEMIRAMSLHGSQVQEADRYYQLEAAKLALTLLQTVQYYHQNGTAFGNGVISSEALRVSKVPGGAAGEEAGYAGYCIVFKGTDPESLSPSSASFDDTIRADLVSIGAVLYELFSGIPPFQNQEDADLFDSLAAVDDVDTDEEDIADAPTKKKRGRASTAVSTDNDCIPLRDLGLPVSIDDLVKSLMKPQNASDQSKQIDYFISNVQMMVDDPDRYLYDIVGGDAPEARCRWGQPGSRLEFSQGKLYGRDEDTALLMSVFERAVRKGGRAEAVTVSGYSGIGKTSLILQLRQPTTERGGFFISGKFDTLRQAKPLSAVAQALDAFCDDLASLPGLNMDTIQAIDSAIGDDTDAITRLIPNLRRIISTKVDENIKMQRRRSSVGLVQEGGDVEIDSKALNRLMYLFRRLFSAIATPTHPMVLFIDDLQWADAMSLDLIREIVCTSGMRSLMFVGSYRSNEVDQDHPLLPQLSQIQGSGVPLLNIELSSMDKSSINALISDTLKLSPLLTRPLSDAVYSKTSGNCLFVVELLSDLHRQNLLRYSVSTRRWEWDDDTIATLEIKSNVVDLMRRKLLRLGATEMWSVKVVACLGAQTQQLALQLLSQGLGLATGNGLATLLQRPIEEGLLMKVGSTYRFSHDQIQQAAYSLVTVGDRSSFHLKLGWSLLKATLSKEELEGDLLFTCVGQLNQGSELITNAAEKVYVAQLNLQAAKSAIASSAFLPASVYLRSALTYLDENDWQDNYGLCLDIYTSLSEIEYVTGKYEEMTIILNEIFARARTFDDKLRAYYTLTSATAAQNDLKAAIRTCFEVLRQLGESFEEKDIDLATSIEEVTTTKSFLENKDKEWFMRQNIMMDRRALNSMKFMNLLMLYIYYSDVVKLPLVVCRMIHLTMQYGLCKVSATAFSSHGVICSGFLGNYAEGYRVGKIAAAIVEKLNAQELLARINVSIYCCINVWVEPLQSTLSPLIDGRNAAIESGDPEYALLAMQLYAMNCFQCGQPLDSIMKDLSKLGRECKEYKMDLVTAVAFPLWQCVEILRSDSGTGNPTVLEGSVIQGDAFLRKQIERGMHSSVCQYYLLRLQLAYTFGRDEFAAEMYDKCMEAELDKNLLGRFSVSICAFYGGLAALSMARKDPTNSKWGSIINTALTRMEKWTAASAWNFEHKLSFLKAEQMANAGDQVGAAGEYEKAIRLAREHRFVNEEALICERYSNFLLSCGETLSASVQYNNAFEAYEKWGALRKCKEMKGTSSASITTGADAFKI